MDTNPIEALEEEKTKLAAEKAQKDLELWHTWNKGGRRAEDLDPLLKRYNPLFNRRMRDWKAPAVSPAAFKAELQKHFIKAVEGYDPNRGASLNTHVQYGLQKAKRFNARYQNVGYIPAETTRHIGKIQSTQNELFEELGHAPTPDEIGERLGLPTKLVSKVTQSLRMDVPSSSFETDPTALSSAREMDVIRLMQRNPGDYFNKEETAVFHHIYGSGGKKKITGTKDLASALGTSQSKISRLKTSIANKVKQSI